VSSLVHNNQIKPTRFDIVIEQRDLTATDRLDLRMAPGGGFAVRLVPIEG